MNRLQSALDFIESISDKVDVDDAEPAASRGRSNFRFDSFLPDRGADRGGRSTAHIMLSGWNEVARALRFRRTMSRSADRAASPERDRPLHLVGCHRGRELAPNARRVMEKPPTS